MSISTKLENSGLKSLLQKNVILILLITFTHMFSNAMLSFTTGMLGQSLGISATVIALIASAYTATGLIMRVPSGALCDGANKKRVLLLALIVKNIAIILFAMANAAGLYAASRILIGISWSFLGVAQSALLLSIVDKKVLGTAFSLSAAVQTLAVTFSRPIAISLFKSVGQSKFGMIVLAISLSSFVFALLLDEKKMTTPETTKTAGSAANNTTKAVQTKRFSLLKGFSIKVLPIALIYAIAYMAFQCDNLYLPGHAENLGLDITAALAISAVIQTVLQFAIGPICDIINPAIVSSISLLAYAAGIMLEGCATTSSVMTIGVILFSIGVKGVTATRIMAIKMVSQKEQGAVQATNYIVQDLWVSVSTPVIGLLVDYMSTRMAFVVSGCAPLLALVILFIVLTHYKKKNAKEQEATV